MEKELLAPKITKTEDDTNAEYEQAEKDGYIYNFLDNKGGDPKFADKDWNLISAETFLDKLEAMGGEHRDSRFVVFAEEMTEDEKQKMLSQQIKKHFENFYQNDISDGHRYAKPRVDVERYFETLTTTSGWRLEERGRFTFVLTCEESSRGD